MTGCEICLRRELLFARALDFGHTRLWILVCQGCVRRRDGEILPLIRERQEEANRLHGRVVAA